MKLHQFMQKSKSFKKELKKQLRFAITAAIGFSIAFAWRESIFDMFKSFVSRFFDLTPEHYSTEIYTAVVITVTGVVLIFLTSKLLKDK